MAVPKPTSSGTGGANLYKPAKKLSIRRIVVAFVIVTGISYGVYNFVLPPSSTSTSTSSSSLDGPLRGTNNDQQTQKAQGKQSPQYQQKSQLLSKPTEVAVALDEKTWDKQRSDLKAFDESMAAQLNAEYDKPCRYKKLSDLPQQELQPVADDTRYMVDPPKGGKLNLVCCKTTKGRLSIIVHHVWAPLGAKRFMEMVQSGYMNSVIPMMRCVKDFLCQFGLTADPERAKKKEFRKGGIPDDPNWLPEGPKFRKNEKGVVRFAKGFLAYAGAGKNSRDVQLIMALKANGPLAGGSPWEVPWGELIGKESFETLDKIYTGYGEDGPGQGKLMSHGMTDEMKKKFPDLDYILSCEVLDEMELPVPPIAPLKEGGALADAETK
mmetsp:Transcript_3667/g.8877  ORF Transcript_3667/g.8877 Transcript_3667/m.8877 type:complete len:380 (-) Transcript_3667:1867-3006(-)|eukprot:CAMPEP_0113463288 /NCGR_PEP_ID=MMETSP0014_2-20120614/12564_1 /TAXON_ID=2857 /ORGANISM="Nitzschia sp." /LENGTH=379 /DNA_ID=CAMNT_0000355245 /DNA_START=38 /DNA_END=1177 /DNA_ORIENTATION=- /assembly_acc=CAM_ASM_000159